LPIGGFVRLYGENREVEAEIPDEVAFWHKPIYQRSLILLGGVMMNFILAVTLFSVVYSVMGIPTQTKKVEIEKVEEGSPAQQYGIMVGDVVKELKSENGDKAQMTNDKFRMFLYENSDKKVRIVLDRQGEEVVVEPILRNDPSQEKGVLGVGLKEDVVFKKYPWWQMPFRGAVTGFKEAVLWGVNTLTGLVMIIKQAVSFKVPEGVSGPIGIYQLSDQVRRLGVLPTLLFTGILSVNLAIFNLLPLPALDGGRVVFLIIEKFRGKKVQETLEYWVNLVGMGVLLALMALITINDIFKLIFRG
jgi:regulator of sigma E protease